MSLTTLVLPRLCTSARGVLRVRVDGQLLEREGRPARLHLVQTEDFPDGATNLCDLTLELEEPGPR